LKLSPDQELGEMLGALSNRPYDFVFWAFPWQEIETALEDQTGPDTWQLKVLWDLQQGLIDIDIAFQIAIRSGHGVGKSAFFSWLVLWAISTCPGCRGRVTANTKEQLMRVLWGELSKWHQLFLARHLFKVTATAIFSSDSNLEKTWRIDAIPWSKDNPEAFAGLHNYGKRLLFLFDEASAIEDIIWETMDGATTDAKTQIIWAVAGNPTRNNGRFRECWDRFAISPENPDGIWHTYQVDARSSKFSNKKLIDKWARAYGEDSDFFRVRVRGEFPNAATTQLIPMETILFAQRREVQSQSWEPLILGVDIARYGSNDSVAQFRRGRDCRTVPMVRWHGLDIIESGHRIASLIAEHQPDAVFIDEGGMGVGVVDFIRSLGHSVFGINFGSAVSSLQAGFAVANKRAEMYVNLREWLRGGGCIRLDDDLQRELVSIEYHFNRKEEIQLMTKDDMKALGRPSPDWADALALTFALPVAARSWRRPGLSKVDYDPLSFEKLVGPSRGKEFSLSKEYH
jgi:hypothetical protein